MKNLLTFFALFVISIGYAQTETVENEQQEIELSDQEIQVLVDSINNSVSYQKGIVELQGSVAKLTIPEGYKFLDVEQSKRVLSDIWGNPPSETLGMLFPESSEILGEDFVYAVEISYLEDGYIDDEDAKDIDYDDLLVEMKEDTSVENEERVKLGYESIEFVGWASEPFYDDLNKKLHWAKELKFSDTDVNTLNYSIRVLGRKGYLNLNVIADMPALPLVKTDVNEILSSVEFNEGYRYAEFNPDIDEVAAYGIGGLIAGKVLAKVGFFAVILKFWKFIAIGAVALFAGFKKRIFGSKEA